MIRIRATLLLGGTTNGTNWVNVNADGDALAQADLA